MHHIYLFKSKNDTVVDFTKLKEKNKDMAEIGLHMTSDKTPQIARTFGPNVADSCHI